MKSPRILHICLTFAALAICAPVISGCCRTRPAYYMVAVDRSTAIFNPPASPIGLADNWRSDWPVAYLPDVTGEEVQYHEQITDIQGRGFGHDNDFLIRRFDSDKFGRTRR